MMGGKGALDQSQKSYRSEMGSGMPMSQSITQIFSSKGGRSGDDGGYAKPMGGNGGEHFGASNDDYGGDFAKLDFDKPLFGSKESGEGNADGGKASAGQGSFAQRSQYSSSSAKG